MMLAQITAIPTRLNILGRIFGPDQRTTSCLEHQAENRADSVEVEKTHKPNQDPLAYLAYCAKGPNH